MIILALFLLFSPRQLSPPQAFVKHCAACHGEEARGTAKGPGLAGNPRVARQSAEQLRAYLERGDVSAGMPSFADLSADELALLVRYLRLPVSAGVGGKQRLCAVHRRKVVAFVNERRTDAACHQRFWCNFRKKAD